MTDLSEIRAMFREELQATRLPVAPVPLQEAAELCHCEYRWLLERVQEGEIKGYRPKGARVWRVYVAEVIKFLTAECSARKPRRRTPRLRSEEQAA